jgi:hypothetical protein
MTHVGGEPGKVRVKVDALPIPSSQSMDGKGVAIMPLAA